MEIGLSQADAARYLNVSHSVVQRLWNQFQMTDSVSRRPVPGQPRVTTPEKTIIWHFRPEEGEPLLYLSSLQIFLSHREEESQPLQYEDTFIMQVCKTIICVCPFEWMAQKCLFTLGMGTCLLDQTTMDFCTLL